ncbi:MAG: T9SS type A sorting domain-containing protein [Candidatus Eisenbacteria bacterium]|nr:T9SS type A sorting domain-containing protein [Candidatus Eisenbacteria bacterium]
MMWKKTGWMSAAAFGAVCLTTVSRADVPLAPLFCETGRLGSVVVGAALAVDTDGDGKVDESQQPGFVTVFADAVPQDASLERAYLYWAGTQDQDEDPCAGAVDDTVRFSPPGGEFTEVAADEVYCSDGEAASYDVWVCRADVTPQVSEICGTYLVEGFDALIANGSTDNASFSLVLLYTAASQPLRDCRLLDGIQTLQSADVPLAVHDLRVPAAPAGTCAWYVLDGDVGGSGGEQVSACGQPGGAMHLLSGPINPSDNPMNHTINTTAPPQTETVGIDLDRLDASPALTPGDDRLDLTYSAGTDKWWLAHTLLEIDREPGDDPCPGGETVARELTCSGHVVTAIEEQEISHLGGSCADQACYGCDGLAQDGPEHVYAFTPQESGTVVVSVGQLNCEVSVYVLEDACDPYSACLAGETSLGTQDVSLSFFAGAGTVYYLVIEASGMWAETCPESIATYEVRFDSGYGGCPEHCANGIDDDFDGATDCADSDCEGDPVCHPSLVMDATSPGARRLSVSPSPCTGSLAIDVVLDEDAALEAELFDVAGRRVVQLARGKRAAGAHTFRWDGRDRHGRPAPPGTYFLRLSAAGTEFQRKIQLLR